MRRRVLEQQLLRWSKVLLPWVHGARRTSLLLAMLWARSGIRADGSTESRLVSTETNTLYTRTEDRYHSRKYGMDPGVKH